ncbi:MAG: YbeD family protein [Halorhodospira sp.]
MSTFNAENTPLAFPCQIGVKAMGHAATDLPDRVKRIAAAHATVVDLRTSGSRHGRYVAVTVTVEAHSREQLEALYQELHEDDAVMVTL